ncbi:MAG: hypothetical protein KAX31_02195, partial [Thermoplasmata archaeon]|nr:hypothetical protein [Thermoplasmata archaeon]
CIIIVDNNATYTGVHVTGGATGVTLKGSLPYYSAVYGINDVGTGIYFDNCNNCGIWDTILGSLTTGIHLGGDCSNALFDYRSSIVNSTTGILLSSGAEENILYGRIGNCTTSVTDNSGNSTNDFGSSITHIHEAIEHIPQFTGEIWFVDVTAGLDTNNGLNPLSPFATIANAINNAAAGDAITVKQGDYYETNLDLNLIGLELWGEVGVTIYNATGTGLSISARNCRVKEIVFVCPGQTAVDLTGNYGILENITTPAPAVGLSVSGQGNRIYNYTVGAPTTTGFDISGPYNQFNNSIASNDIVAARGFYLSTADAILNVFKNCTSIGNTIRG